MKMCVRIIFSRVQIERSCCELASARLPRHNLRSTLGRMYGESIDGAEQTIVWHNKFIAEIELLNSPSRVVFRNSLYAR
jgi:hypothetical protein